MVFSFYVLTGCSLKALSEMKKLLDFPFKNLKYVMTDFADSNFKFWLVLLHSMYILTHLLTHSLIRLRIKDHPALKPYFDSGLLDAGKFDLLKRETVTLWKAGTVLGKLSYHSHPAAVIARMVDEQGPGTCKNPVVLIANYVFDTLNSDTFRVEGGELFEGLLSLGSKQRFEPVSLGHQTFTFPSFTLALVEGSTGSGDHIADE